MKELEFRDLDSQEEEESQQNSSGSFDKEVNRSKTKKQLKRFEYKDFFPEEVKLQEAFGSQIGSQLPTPIQEKKK